MTRPAAQRQTLLRTCSIFPAAAFVALGLTACSAVPDAVNPVEWYRGVAGVFEDDKQQEERAEEKVARQTTAPLPGTDKPYPSLSSVPNRPQATSAAERGKIAQGLAADRQNARYAESGAPQGAAAPAADLTPPAVAGLPPTVSRPPVAETLAQPVPAPEPMPAPMPAPQQTAALPPPVAPAVPISPPRATPVPVPTAPASAAFPQGFTQSATVFFANNSTALDADGRTALRQVAEGFKANGGTVRIVGFASGQAANANAQIANFRVAGQRAEAAAVELNRLGVPLNRMIISSGNAGAADAALARRVEVSLDY